MKPLLTVIILVAVGLAGCADDEPTDPTVDGAVDADTFQLQAGKGAIEGLLVDDRFRPIHLTDDPQTEFDAEGFVLLQETGEQVQTDENGQFAFVDLDPGAYTLRVTAEGHEAIPASIDVVEGVFAEASVVARRISSTGSIILTEEFSAFAPCFLNWVIYSLSADCTGDLSGETARADYSRNWTDYPIIEAAVVEVQFNQEPPEGGALDAVARKEIYHDFSSCVLFEGTYCKMHLYPDEISPDEVPVGTEFYPWYQNETTNIIIFGRGYLSEDIRNAYAPIYDNVGQDAPCPQEGLPVVGGLCAQNNSMRRGVGGSLGVQAKYLVSLFVGEPEVDPQVYCVLCDGVV